MNCPNCGSDNVSLPSRSSDLGWKVIRQCFHCQHIFFDEESTPVEDLLERSKQTDDNQNILFTLKSGEIPYINPIFAYTLINEPDKINPLKLKARVRFCIDELSIDKDGYVVTELVNSIELYQEKKK